MQSFIQLVTLAAISGGAMYAFGVALRRRRRAQERAKVAILASAVAAALSEDTGRKIRATIS